MPTRTISGYMLPEEELILAKINIEIVRVLFGGKGTI